MPVQIYKTTKKLAETLDTEAWIPYLDQCELMFSSDDPKIQVEKLLNGVAKVSFSFDDVITYLIYVQKTNNILKPYYNQVQIVGKFENDTITGTIETITIEIREG